MSAEHIKPEGWKENRQFVAKTMLKLGRADDAVAWLKKAEEMPIKNPDVSNPAFQDSSTYSFRFLLISRIGKHTKKSNSSWQSSPVPRAHLDSSRCQLSFPEKNCFQIASSFQIPSAEAEDCFVNSIEHLYYYPVGGGGGAGGGGYHFRCQLESDSASSSPKRSVRRARRGGGNGNFVSGGGGRLYRSNSSHELDT